MSEKIVPCKAETFDPYIAELGDILLPNSLVLDMGCWEGNSGNYLAARGHRVVSVDLDKEAIRRAVSVKQALGNSATNRFINGDMLHPMFKNETFDVVISTIVLHEIVPKSRAVEALHSVFDLTKPGGVNLTRVYIGTPLQQSTKADKYSVFGPTELMDIYDERGWQFVKPPIQTPGPLELNRDGSISAIAQVIACKPSY